MGLEDKKIKKRAKFPVSEQQLIKVGLIFRIPDLLNKKSINEKSIENKNVKNDKFFQCCFLVFVNFVNFWTIFGQFFSSPNKKLLFLTKKIKNIFYDFLSSKISFLNEKFFSDNFCHFLDNFWTIFLFSL